MVDPNIHCDKLVCQARPILMSAPMVNACLREDDPKSQTRRIVKEPVQGWLNGNPKPIALGHKVYDYAGEEILAKCPYGKPGDLLYVREACWIYGQWHKDGTTKTGRQKWRFKEALQRIVLHDQPPTGAMTFQGWDKPGFVWRTSIHMPRWASRLTLRITDVRLERLQEISEAAAKAEGCGTAIFETIVPVRASGVMHSAPCYRAGYACLWDQINGAGSWEANPWVWCISFIVIRKNVDEVLKDMANG